MLPAVHICLIKPSKEDLQFIFKRFWGYRVLKRENMRIIQYTWGTGVSSEPSRLSPSVSSNFN